MADFLRYPCEDCEFGTLRPGRATLARWYGRHFIIVPDLPTWECDVCGWMEYDQGAVLQLEAILGSTAELDQEHARRLRRQRTEHTAVQRNSS